MMQITDFDEQLQIKKQKQSIHKISTLKSIPLHSLMLLRDY